MDLTYKRHSTETLYLQNLVITNERRDNDDNIYVSARSKSGGALTLKLDEKEIKGLLAFLHHESELMWYGYEGG